MHPSSKRDRPPPGGEGSFFERFIVEVNYDGWRLDRYLTEKLRRASRARVSRFIRAGVRVSGRLRHKPGTTVRAGDVVEIERVERGDPGAPTPGEVVVIFDSPDVVIIDKPAGLLVHRTAREATRTVDAFLESHFDGRKVEAAHRIDRDTSGLIACGANRDSLRVLQSRFARGEPDKVYRALVTDPERRWHTGGERTFDAPLGFDPESAIAVRVGPGDWACRTLAKCVGRRGDIAALDVRMERGRQHQIRAHLSLFGTPLVGDKLYAEGDAFFARWCEDPGAPALVSRLATRWHCLHAWRLCLEVAGEAREFEAPLPPRMQL